RPPPPSPLFPYTTLFRSSLVATDAAGNSSTVIRAVRANTTPPKLQLSAPVSGLVTSLTTVTVSGQVVAGDQSDPLPVTVQVAGVDRKSTRLNSSHVAISY